MNKKGMAEGIDWVIAFGLFLVYIALVFVFFKPGVHSFYEQDTLISIVQEELTKETTWEIAKKPIFITPIEENAIAEYTVELAGDWDKGNGDSEIKTIIQSLGQDRNANLEAFYVKSRWDDNRGIANQRYLTQTEETGSLSEEQREEIKTLRGKKEENEVRSVANSPRGVEPSVNEDERAFSLRTAITDKGNLIIPAKLEWTVPREKPATTKYILLYSNEKINFNPNPLETATAVKKACAWKEVGQGIPDIYEKDAQTQEKCDAIYITGLEEKLKGVSLLKFNRLGTQEIKTEQELYKETKTRWGFPESKEFRIDIYNPEENIHEIFPKAIIVPDDVNVEARLINSFILDDEGNKKPVIISIKVW